MRTVSRLKIKESTAQTSATPHMSWKIVAQRNPAQGLKLPAVLNHGLNSSRLGISSSRELPITTDVGRLRDRASHWMFSCRVSRGIPRPLGVHSGIDYNLTANSGRPSAPSRTSTTLPFQCLCSLTTPHHVLKLRSVSGLVQGAHRCALGGELCLFCCSVCNFTPAISLCRC
jgi:hypothetical protein